MQRDEFLKKWKGKTLDDSVLAEFSQDLERFERSIKNWSLPIPKDETLRCLVFWDEVAWVAVWLDRYVVSQGSTPEAALEALAFVMRGYQLVAVEHGEKDALESLTHSAPAELWGRLRRPMS